MARTTNLYAGTDLGFQVGGGGPGDKRKKKFQIHIHSINKLSTKTYTQKSSFLNILRYNHLSTKTKDTNH